MRRLDAVVHFAMSVVANRFPFLGSGERLYERFRTSR